MTPKVVFVIGPESTGSTLIARICGYALCGVPMDSGEKTQWTDGDDNQVWHVSLPSGAAARFPDLDAWVRKYGDTHAIHFVLTTRDITLSEFSRRGRFMRRGSDEVRVQSEKAREIMVHATELGYPWHVLSYESLIFLGRPYLDLLYRFIGVESEFMPTLRDANLKRLESMGIVDSMTRWLRRAWFVLRGGQRRSLPDDTRFPASEQPGSTE